MNRKIAFLALALLIGASFVGSCGNDEEPQPNENQPTDTITAATDSIIGWTSATHVPPQGQQYFKDFYSPGEATVIKIKKDERGLLTLDYSSTAWGNATFANMKVQEAKGRYILPDSVQTTIVMSRGAMGQQGGGGEYPLTLLQGSVSTDLKDVTLVMSAFMNERHGSYELTFHPGTPDPTIK